MPEQTPEERAAAVAAEAVKGLISALRAVGDAVSEMVSDVGRAFPEALRQAQRADEQEGGKHGP